MSGLAYDHSIVWEYFGPNKYLLAAVCKTVALVYSSRFGKVTARNISTIAAVEGNLSMLKWCKEAVGCLWNESVFLSAVGHIDVLTWLMQTDIPISKDERACTLSASKGDLDCLKLCRLYGCLWNEDTCNKAAAGGHLHIIQFVRDFRGPCNLRAICAASAQHGHIHILEWASEIGHSLGEIGHMLDADVCMAAAKGGRLNVLRWLVEVKNCRMNSWTCWEAVTAGHLDVLKYAIENGCHAELRKILPSGGTLLHDAAQLGYKDIIMYLLESGADIDCVDLEGWTPLYAAAVSNNCDVVQLLIDMGAGVNIKNGWGITPLKAVRGTGHTNIIEAILSAGGVE